jgi:hypothetical protein
MIDRWLQNSTFHYLPSQPEAAFSYIPRLSETPLSDQLRDISRHSDIAEWRRYDSSTRQ